MYARTIEEKRRSILLATGGEHLDAAPDLPIGSKEIGFYDPVTKTWSEPASNA